VTKPEQSKISVRTLTAAGWKRDRTSGSHSHWKCPSGEHGYSLPDGHTTISPAIVRGYTQAIKNCNCKDTK
jgi:predicted RNA binding protein YcfA (HicA-like mRNA interferase family)